MILFWNTKHLARITYIYCDWINWNTFWLIFYYILVNIPIVALQNIDFVPQRIYFYIFI